MAHATRVVDYWIGKVGPAGWYAGGQALDDDVRTRFFPLWAQARAGGLRDWWAAPDSALAFVILTDQFPRNMFRGRPESFVTDALARQAAHHALARGFDLRVSGPPRQFFYLPFEHSEYGQDQHRAVALFAQRLPDPENLLHARAHREVIRRFSRFPGRNAALGRHSLPAELAFEAAGGYGGLVRAMRAAHDGG